MFSSTELCTWGIFSEIAYLVDAFEISMNRIHGGR